ncbi:class I SAM-dependent methyltransferase [Actinospica robiniae]|uniref:class I SAM-dependent methyltransferase n=1 Tax=Actinospica robiniae TaxID=304901 RepID=UPI0004062C1B|nr:class I SAM-dependent methyltransferase [Actinospica robiniae]
MAQEQSKFDTASTARHYAAARPTYPEALFDALDELLGGRLAGADVLDVAAGTGIATRQLAQRGAHVTAVELSGAMLGELVAATPGARVVQGSGNALPLADDSADLITYAQAWHWMDQPRALAEARRVLRPHGVLALWWNQTSRESGWEWEQRERISAANMQWHHHSAEHAWENVDLDPDLPKQSFSFDWQRTVPLETHLANLASKSYIAELGDGMQAFLDRERAILSDLFPDGEITERFTTLLAATLFGRDLSLAGRG